MAAKIKQLDPKSRAIFDALAEQVIPSGGPDYPGARDIDLAGKMTDKLSQVPGGLQAFQAFLLWWEYSPFTFSLQFKKFTRMTPEQQVAYMESWEKSRFFGFRMAFVGIKGVFMAFFYNSPEVWEKIGYREECLYKGASSEV